MIQKSYLTKKTQPSAHPKYAHRYTLTHAHVEAYKHTHRHKDTQIYRDWRTKTLTQGRAHAYTSTNTHGPIDSHSHTLMLTQTYGTHRHCNYGLRNPK